MKDLCAYLIQLRGQVTEEEINNMSPLKVTVVRADAVTTQISISTDQSGLIGLLRHLHGRGYVLNSIICET